MLHLVSTSPTPAAPLARQPDGLACDEPLLAFAEPVAGAHALVVAERGSELLCSLIRRGCLAATSLRLAAKPEAGIYDLVVAPRVTSIDCPDRLVNQAARALVPTGRFIARVIDDRVGHVSVMLAHSLRLHGFTAVRTRIMSGETLVRADQPAFGLAVSA